MLFYRRSVSLEKIQRIAGALEIDTDQLFYGGGSEMIETLEDFIREFKKIKALGWIETHRSGPTGIGKTLEDLLGIPENNIDGPDFGDYELKSCRLDSKSMLTIFTKTPQPKGAANTLRMTFGYCSDAYDNDEKVLHTTLSANRYVAIADTGRQLKIHCHPAKISIVDENKKEYAYWTRDGLKKAFEKKVVKSLITFGSNPSTLSAGIRNILNSPFRLLETNRIVSLNATKIKSRIS